MSSKVSIESEVDLTSTWTRSSGLLREALLDAMVTVTLSETDTVLLFEQPAVRVQQDSAESRLVCVYVCACVMHSCLEGFFCRTQKGGGFVRVAFGPVLVRRLIYSLFPPSQVTAANQRYEALCVTLSKSSAELYPSRSSETLVPPTKHKEVCKLRLMLAVFLSDFLFSVHSANCDCVPSLVVT